MLGFLSRSTSLRWLLAPALLACGAAPAQEQTPELRGAAVLLEVDGPIGPATSDYLRRGIERAGEDEAALVVIRINTPGGLDAATRDINRAILASKVPVLTWVAPSGARAASAGTYIVYASHLAAMAPATNLGAATPISIGGPGAPEAPQPPSERDKDSAKDDDQAKSDDEAEDDDGKAQRSMEPASTAERKARNDAVAYLRSLAQMRGRSVEFAEAAVNEAATLTADEALEQGVVEIVAADLEQLLAQADGRKLKLGGHELVLHSADVPVQTLLPDWRNRLLAVITDPTVAYLLLLIGLYGLIFEGYNPGAVLPGVVGAISLLLALYALQLLPVNYAGVALIALGLALLVTEVFMPSFGALGIGGLIALMAGSIMLLDRDVPGFEISRGVILGLGVGTALVFFGILQLAARARHRPAVTGDSELVGQRALVLDDFHGRGYVQIRGETWQAECGEPLHQGQWVRVNAIDGLVLRVQPESRT